MGPDHGEKWYRTRSLFSILFLVCVVQWKWNFIFALETLKNTDRELLRPGPFSGKRVAAVASAQRAETCLILDPGAAKSKDRPQPLTAEPSAQGLGLLKTLLMPKAMETGWVWIVKELFTPHSNGKIITDKGAIAFEPAVVTDQLVTVVWSSSDLLWGLNLAETKCGVGTAFSLS